MNIAEEILEGTEYKIREEEIGWGAMKKAEGVVIVTRIGEEPADKANNWYFKIYGHSSTFGRFLIKQEEGFRASCDCIECWTFGPERYELYAAVLALHWIDKVNPNAAIILSMTTRKLVAASLDDLIETNTFECDFLGSLYSKLIDLLYDMDVTITR